MKKQKEQEKEYHTDGQEELDLVGGRVAYKVKENLEKIGGIVSGGKYDDKIFSGCLSNYKKIGCKENGEK